ncbi:PhnD/SsuA/transferrin family substrate-binding protein [Effusibacillus dendaii]|uniref:Uncharacterized protein n=1 Tax=Effusibacillus dendaii TaxID=2743772 RepID=A0A7I8D5Y0_9BACL|nr:PhnD/SsuA/transferrin family substrate-binding protein [Effusibacillus dendaii]BCJ85553.1 hypothetical protein skT53_05380 [Effusibacillus dendaii]
MISQGVIKQDEINVIWKSDLIPGSPIAVRSDLDPEIKKKLKQALISVHEKDPSAIGGIGKVEKYMETNKEFYNPVRDAANLLGIDLAKKK